MACAQQVSQYELQLQQYANQVKNTVAPVAQVWQAAQQTMNSVLGTVSMFENGSQLQSYLNQYPERQSLAIGLSECLHLTDRRICCSKASE
jgi:P-type conjugative transfer protein TrbJ